MSDLHDFLGQTLPRQIAAEEALHRGDVRPRLEMWSSSDPVTVLGAAVPKKAGWDDVSASFRWIASRYSRCDAFTFELLAAGVSGDLAYTVGFEHSDVVIDDRPLVHHTLRVTHVYRRENGTWKIVHRHGDHPPVAPSDVS